MAVLENDGLNLEVNPVKILNAMSAEERAAIGLDKVAWTAGVNSLIAEPGMVDYLNNSAHLCLIWSECRAFCCFLALFMHFLVLLFLTHILCFLTLFAHFSSFLPLFYPFFSFFTHLLLTFNPIPFSL